MNYLKKILLVLCLSFFIQTNAQTIFNGTQVYTAPNSIISIKTDSLLLDNNAYFLQEGLLVIDKDLQIISGKNEINGTVQINENLVNNDTIIGLTNSSIIDLKGNWTNNNTFIPGFNTTNLKGNYQQINGLQNTDFYNLNTIGILADQKELVNVDVSVSNILDLTDVELATNTNKISILSPLNTAIIRNNGFVSSEGTGRLERNTNTSQEYFFPTGSTNGTIRYRPVSVRPQQGVNQTFAVRLANVNPNTDNYSTSLADDSLCNANLDFYHKIYGNNPADISVFYLENEDGIWNTNAHWQNGVWNKMANDSEFNVNNFSVVKNTNWNQYATENFVLGFKKPFMHLDESITAYYSEDIILEALYTGPTPYDINWSPSENLDCPNCLETGLTAFENEIYTIEIDATENCRIKDSIKVIITPFDIQFPTGFSPNNDGVNDVFIPMNTNLESFEMKIFNRWGELIFETENPRIGWNGVYKTKKAEIGVYTYNVNYKIANQNQNKIKTGTITLLR